MTFLERFPILERFGNHEQQIDDMRSSTPRRSRARIRCSQPQATLRRICTLPFRLLQRRIFSPRQNHAFIDGNKRVGANAAITFLCE